MSDNSNENMPLQSSGTWNYGSSENQASKDESIPVEYIEVDNYNIDLDERARFTILAFLMQILIIILYGLAIEYPSPLSPPDAEDVSHYLYFQQVNVMMFIGFGYLMTFLRRYGYGAVTFNMMLTVLCIEWGIFMVGLVDVIFGVPSHKLNIGVDNLAQGDIAAAVILISFGAVKFYTYIFFSKVKEIPNIMLIIKLLGRASPTQLLVMGFIEIIFYSINNYVVTEILYVTDVGGSIVVHTFGCYFGLAVSYILGPL